MQVATEQNIGKRVVVVGAGGNIGSHLVPHLARLTEVMRVTLIDRDHYEQTNLRSQNVTTRDLGKTKAMVQAHRLRRINPTLLVHPIVDTVENVPLGHLRADIIVACVDSRSARQSINQIAWHLGIPWIDAGIRSEGLLARINVYMPGPDSPCLECSWDAHDYNLLEQTYPCQGEEREPAPTNAPSSLGALAAALQAIECQKLLTGQWEHVAVSRQVLVDVCHHQHYVTTFQRNPHCRFDHQVWAITPLPYQANDLTLQQSFALRGKDDGEESPPALRLAGQTFVRQLTCFGCGQTKPVWRFTRRLHQVCGCGQALVAAGFDLQEWLAASELPPALKERSLRNLGVRDGDIITLRTQTHEFHYQVGV
jgi:molybdopterin/thiamine biosynthesis adenylyltransferase